MSESQSRYSIINQLLVKKNGFVNQLDELEETEQRMEKDVKNCTETLEEWKKSKPRKKELIETQIKNTDESLEAIEDISKDTK